MATVQRKLVHKQFNSPIGLYSDENVKETLDRELRAISNGAVGIETSDQHRPVNLSNSAVLKMLEEQEGERISASNERKSRLRQREVIDRETVLKINRRHPRRRDMSWPPPKSEDSQSRSSSEEIHFDDKVRKRREIAHLKKMFEEGSIRGDKRENISRLLSPEDVRRAPQGGDVGEKENLPNVYNIYNVCSGKGVSAPRSVCPSGDESPVRKTFHLPEDELHIGLIEPIKKYFEEGSSVYGTSAGHEVIPSACLSALKRWKSFDSVAQDQSPAEKPINEQFGNMSNNNLALKRYKSSSYTELPPLKPPRRESNKNEPPTKEKLNFNNLKKFPEDYNMEQTAGKNDGKNSRPRGRNRSGERKFCFHESAQWPPKTPVFGTNLITKNKSAGWDNNGTGAADSAVFSNDHENGDDVTSAIKNRRITTASNISGLNYLSCSGRNECITAPSSKCKEQKIASLGHQPRTGGGGGGGNERPVSVGSTTTGCGGENSRENKTIQPESYDLAAEPRSDAKNSRSHNLSTQLNEHVNVVATNRGTTAFRTAPMPSNDIKPDSDTKYSLKVRGGTPPALESGGHQQPTTGGNCLQKSDETNDSPRHGCNHPQDFVDHPVQGSHKPKCDENLQEPSSVEEQGNIARVVRRSLQRRLEDNDDYMGKYNQREISKSGLSVTASERRDRGRGVYYTDGEFIWGPFEDAPPFNEISASNNERSYDSRGIPEKDSALSSNGTNSLNFHKATVGFERKQHPKGQQINFAPEIPQNTDENPQMEGSEIEGNVEQKLLDIQKSIAGDLQRIYEYMETAESTLCDAEKHLIESSLSESAYVLDTPIEAAIKEALQKRPSRLSAPEAPLRTHQISYFGPRPIRAENMPETKHALVDLYNISRALDALNNLISGDSSTRITEIDDSEDRFPTAGTIHTANIPRNGAQPQRSSSSTSDSETGVTNVDKIIQSKNILSGYLIAKQNQEMVLQKAGIPAVCDSTKPQNENTIATVDLPNEKSRPFSPRRWPPPPPPPWRNPSAPEAPRNGPLKIDEREDYSEVVAPNNEAHLTGKSDCPDERRKFYEPEKSSPSGNNRQLSPHHPCTQELTTSRYDASEGISCDDTINKDNKFGAGRDEDPKGQKFAPGNETIHGSGLQSGGRDERVTADNPNAVSAIRSGRRQEHQRSTPYGIYGLHRHREQPQTGNEPAHFDVMKSNASESGGTAHDYRRSTGKQDRQNTENEIKEKLDCERSLSFPGNYPEGDYHGNYTDESPRNETRPDRFNRRGQGGSNEFRSSSQPSTPLLPNWTNETPEDPRQQPLVRQHSFDSSERHYFASPSLFMTGHFCRAEGYKRVAWPPVSEGTPVKGSTPQPQQQPQHQGGQNYYSQPTQPQYPQQYGGHSPQPHQQQQPAPQYYQQQHHQPRLDSNLYQQQQPSQPEQSYNRPQGGQQPSQGFRPVQPSTVAFTGGAAQKHIPSLPGQPNYPPVEQPLPAPITFPQYLPSQYGSGGQYSPQPQHTQNQPLYQQNQPSYQQNQPPYQQAQPQYRAQQSPQPQHPHGQYGPQSPSPYLISPSGQRSEPAPGNPPPRGWSHVTSPTPTRTGYTQGPPNYPPSANLPQFGSESHFGPHQPQSQQSYESPVSHQPSYGQQYPQQKYSEPQQYYPQGQPQYQFDRGQSPGIIQLRKEAPVSQQPAPVVTSQPAARNFRGGSNMRGDLKWPPPEVKAQMEAEEEQRRSLATGPAVRPRRVNKDYTKFFAQHALNSTYPGYKVPPGTQHIYAEF